jgi:uncharacterized protein DUF1552
MFLTKKHLPRRTFLRGMGATVALPLLDAMIPAHTAWSTTKAKPSLRFAACYVPHGSIMARWDPTGDGSDFEFSPILKPLEPFRDRLTVVSGTCSNFEGGHVISNATWLNGVAPRRTEAEDVRSGVTIDQMIAAKAGNDTALPSLELALEDYASFVGNCEPGLSCVYLNTLSWRTPTTPLPMEINPRAVFERMFGDRSTTGARAARQRNNGSILDSITNDVGRLRQSLGPADRGWLESYLENLREIERRVQQASEQQNKTSVEMPDTPLGVPHTFEEHCELMFDLQVLAFQADLTRVITFMLARELSTRTYPAINVVDGHHQISHHQNVPTQMDRHARVNTYHVKHFAGFLEKLRSTPDGDGNLLDHSMILYGSGMGNGNVHSHDPLPILVAGGGMGQIKGNQHVKVPFHTPLANLLLTLVGKGGLDVEKVGNSTGRIDI